MEHPIPIHPQDHARYDAKKMGKSTLYRSAQMLVGLNAFEPGQEHALHAHVGMDKVYHVIEGSGLFLLDANEVPMTQECCSLHPTMSRTEYEIPVASGCSS